jgi:hypothetical protein
MRVSSLIAGAVALAGLAGAAQAAPVQANPKGEAELARLLAGRVPGKPVDCVPLHGGSHSSRIIDGTAVVWEDGSTIYVNRPSNAESLRSGDIIAFATSLSQLCRVDIVHTLDQSTHMQTGSISLQDFVPYRRAPKG